MKNLIKSIFSSASMLNADAEFLYLDNNVRMLIVTTKRGMRALFETWLPGYPSVWFIGRFLTAAEVAKLYPLNDTIVGTVGELEA